MNKEKLYEAFGELIYAVAMVDGVIQQEEKDALDKILRGHSWANEIKWSFNYEMEHRNFIDYLYNKVVDACHQAGPQPEYKFLIEIMEEIANASNGIDSAEEKIIESFSKDLTARFRRDLELQ